MLSTAPQHLSEVTKKARERYGACLRGVRTEVAWWDDVIVTASSSRQAERYRREIDERLKRGTLPASTAYRVVPDPEGQRIGSGGATLNSLRILTDEEVGPEWSARKILIIHSGGDSRRLPQYSLSGKLFSLLPLKTSWGEPSTLFDEYLALSSLWAEVMPAGLLVGSGDVLLVFDPAPVDWARTGVHGIAIRQPAEVAAQHGVYILGPKSTVYGFLQKPSLAELRAAGGELDGSTAAVDTGLLYFSPKLVERLNALANRLDWKHAAELDLYTHFTGALTSQWRPAEGDGPALQGLSEALGGEELSATQVEGEFTHIGGTRLFHRLMTEETSLSQLYSTQQRLGSATAAGVASRGVVIDSVLDAAEIGDGAIALECRLEAPVRVARGGVIHGLEDIDAAVEAPEDTVLHMVPVSTSDKVQGVVIRVYGVDDNPKEICGSSAATWLARPLLEALSALEISPEEVWPNMPAEQRCLWNAELFPVESTAAAWQCARWMLGLAAEFDAARWSASVRLSLATSTEFADEVRLLESRARRAQAGWERSAVQLALEGADIRPMLAQPPGLAALASVGSKLLAEATRLEASKPTQAASHCLQASLFYAQAGREGDSEAAHAQAFEHVLAAVRGGASSHPLRAAARWRFSQCGVLAPARVDFGGGWSDTPPFCLDWGGVVLNAAVSIGGALPVQAQLRVTPEHVIRCVQGGESSPSELRTREDLFSAPGPGEPAAIPRTVLQMSGLFDAEEPLEKTLERLGGGLEIETRVALPLGSGLGTSSLLAAAVAQALHSLAGQPLGAQPLIDHVLNIEQRMSTGGGWQDQAGGIFPGLKVITSGPGPRQRLHVREIRLSPERARELESMVVLAWTGITRVAKNLLQEVVGRYLARETRAVEVLHSIKTLALEMAHAIENGEWDYFGELLNRHWELNKVLDPNTTNAPIEAMLARLSPHLRGAKLAGAGGGGFLILLAKSAQDAEMLREALAGESAPLGGAVHGWRLAPEGLRVETRG
jgi:fucokinase